MTWKCHVDEPTKGGYDMISVGDLLKELVLNINFSGHVIEVYFGPFIGAMAPMVDLGAYVFKDLNTGKIKLEESFTDAYVEELYES